MSEPARKRRDRRLPQWRQRQPPYNTPQSLSTDTSFTANSNPVGASQSANVPPAFLVENPPLSFFHNYPGVLIPDIPGAKPLLPHFGNVPLLPSFEGDAQTQFNPGGDISESVFLTAVNEPWQNPHGESEAPLTAPAPDYDPDLLFPTLPAEDIWRDTSLYRLDGGRHLKPYPVVSAADVRSLKRGSCSLWRGQRL